MKNINKFIGGLLMSGVLLAGVGVNAQAATQAAANTTGKTDVTAAFTKSSQVVNPVDPTDPTKPGTGGDGNNGATPGGDLSLIYVSNKLDFGSHEIDPLNGQSYSADGTTGLWNSKAVVEVSDVRGTNAGWTLGVSGTALTGTDGTTIKGATLALPQGSVTNSGSSSNGATATAATDVLGASATVLGAKDTNGAGVTIDQLDPTNIKLTIPANTAKAQAYTSTLTWTLSDTPAS